MVCSAVRLHRFPIEIQLPPLFLYQGQYIIECILAHDPQKYDAYWYHPDHLGSSNYITNFIGNISQHTCPERSRRMEYLPFGETLVEEHLNSYNSPYRFNGKELDEATGWYYYGARYYNPKWSIWLSVDPLAGKYPSLSPYTYTANNPINFIDPDGRQIDPASQKEWDKQKIEVAVQYAATAVAHALTGSQGEKFASLNETMNTLNTLENSCQVYSLNKMGGELGGVTYDTETGNIEIAFGTTANFVHESAHAGQYESGDLAFNYNTGKTLAQDVGDEVAAYKAQYAYDPTSVSNLKSSSSIKSLSNITTSWVQGITTSDGSMPYSPSGDSNLGIAPVNINTNREGLIKAYPGAASSLRGLPASFTLKDLTGIYYKR